MELLLSSSRGRWSHTGELEISSKSRACRCQLTEGGPCRINFATALNPNGNPASPVSQIVKRSLNLTDWPAYGVDGRVDMLQLEASNLTVIQDDYREEAISYILSIPEALGQ
jgi:hypothetical protein